MFVARLLFLHQGKSGVYPAERLLQAILLAKFATLSTESTNVSLKSTDLSSKFTDLSLKSTDSSADYINLSIEPANSLIRIVILSAWLIVSLQKFANSLAKFIVLSAKFADPIDRVRWLVATFRRVAKLRHPPKVAEYQKSQRISHIYKTFWQRKAKSSLVAQFCVQVARADNHTVKRFIDNIFTRFNSIFTRKGRRYIKKVEKFSRAPLTKDLQCDMLLIVDIGRKVLILTSGGLQEYRGNTPRCENMGQLCLLGMLSPRLSSLTCPSVSVLRRITLPRFPCDAGGHYQPLLAKRLTFPLKPPRPLS